MKKVTIDTNIFIRLFTIDDEVKFKKAKELIEKAEKGKIKLLVPYLVIAEIVWVLEKVYKRSKIEISEVITAIINTPGIEVELFEVIEYAIELYKDKNIKFTDAFIASWSIFYKVDEIITFDETDFKKVEKLKVRNL
ncbi:hypothetical protein JCM14244_11940 [Venenivibrio stagnispumantis]|uniref:Predicted nucleic-acid-binding protein, contains PIN domain n=1 Tax=Venenivibrio stagnispumantis TaxID=407998 RepID=A0AA45WNR2_9AQUI|nr:PIN domain-containing protein [Venenivibrio stagnispumantis]MCW4573256.1 PIN domain-containing protein [Venenivibrio stagnispumantis]SMP18261.1 Predicted nucleic-acid-binding protein, contains PIN domain [Venenivibrio stagnispumantis]